MIYKGSINYRILIMIGELIGLIFLLNCAPIPYMTRSYTESHKKPMLHLNCTVISDSAIKSFSEDPRRAKALISQRILEHNSNISDFINNIDSIFKRSDTVRIGLSLSSGGKFATLQDKNDLKLDSLKNIQFIELLNTFQFDSIPSYPFSVHIFLMLNKMVNNNINISLLDSVQYYLVRSKKSIMEVVMLNLPYLRYTYNWRLRQE